MIYNLIFIYFKLYFWFFFGFLIIFLGCGLGVIVEYRIEECFFLRDSFNKGILFRSWLILGFLLKYVFLVNIGICII